MKINGREIGPDCPPYIIAEVGANHCGEYEVCEALIDSAANAGASAVKLQCYTPDSITLDCDKDDFIIHNGPWSGVKLYDLYNKAHTPMEWFPDLFKRAKNRDITLFASVFDKTSVDLLESLDCPAYKIASMEVIDIPLIQYAAKTGKPMILSTGMATIDEMGDAATAVGRNDLAVLHCISGYPTKIAEANLPLLKFWRGGDGSAEVGISDHTLGCNIPIAATALGATIIEKHVKFEEYDSEDAEFSMDVGQFAVMCHSVNEIWKATRPSFAQSQESSRQLRRSLYVVADIKAGETFTEANVRSIRPSYGLLPRYLPKVLGKTAAVDIERGTALAWHMIS